MPDSLDVDINIIPTETTLDDLLSLAEASREGVVTLEGRMENDTVQWGIITVCCDNAGELMSKLQAVVDEHMAAVLSKDAN